MIPVWMRLGSWTVDPHGITSAFPDGISMSTRRPVRFAKDAEAGRVRQVTLMLCGPASDEIRACATQPS